MKIIDLTWHHSLRVAIVLTFGVLIAANIISTFAGVGLDLQSSLSVPLNGLVNEATEWSATVIEIERAVSLTLPSLLVTFFACGLSIAQFGAVLWVFKRCLELRPLFLVTLLMAMILIYFGALEQSGLLLTSSSEAEHPQQPSTDLIAPSTLVLGLIAICLFAITASVGRQARQTRSIEYVTTWRLLPTFWSRSRAGLGLMGAIALFLTLSAGKLLLITLCLFFGLWLLEDLLRMFAPDFVQVWGNVMLLFLPMALALGQLFREIYSRQRTAIGVTAFAVYALFSTLGLLAYGSMAVEGSNVDAVIEDLQRDGPKELVLLLRTMFIDIPLGLSWIGPGIAFRRWIIASPMWPIQTVKDRFWIGVPELLNASKRKPIIFLRAFQDDQIEVRKSFGLADWICGTPASRMKLEGALSDAPFPVAPFIALNNPHEPSRAAGAVKAHSDDALWRDTVVGWLNKCEFVVMVLGSTSNLHWELEKIIEMDLLDKLILVTPPNYPIRPTIFELQPLLAKKLGFLDARDEKRAMMGVRAFVFSNGQPCAIRHGASDEISYQDSVRLGLAMSRSSGWT